MPGALIPDRIQTGRSVNAGTGNGPQQIQRTRIQRTRIRSSPQDAHRCAQESRSSTRYILPERIQTGHSVQPRKPQALRSGSLDGIPDTVRRGSCRTSEQIQTGDGAQQIACRCGAAHRTRRNAHRSAAAAPATFCRSRSRQATACSHASRSGALNVLKSIHYAQTGAARQLFPFCFRSGAAARQRFGS